MNKEELVGKIKLLIALATQEANEKRLKIAEYLGKTGHLTSLLREIRYLNTVDRVMVGNMLNDFKEKIIQLTKKDK